ncbi:hypothetical protein GCM10010211_47560 [Streptomyces albospinus]|uniref:Uncharacterized protein n=1 Tax=Streptomyces albospinus TaxID=285515 RepID=A0ABQ2VBS2_9ACTN|nr:hypothetical protein GCM10010211_47560 [Streptomyces albospinus]
MTANDRISALMPSSLSATVARTTGAAPAYPDRPRRAARARPPARTGTGPGRKPVEKRLRAGRNGHVRCCYGQLRAPARLL